MGVSQVPKKELEWTSPATPICYPCAKETRIGEIASHLQGKELKEFMSFLLPFWWKVLEKELLIIVVTGLHS